ncbi:MAG: hypothetical protein KIT31_30505 [Deltaproteobacteria bacterium]|nr:hypothetical protein [Deltaproteobacteria bacterium]
MRARRVVVIAVVACAALGGSSCGKKKSHDGDPAGSGSSSSSSDKPRRKHAKLGGKGSRGEFSPSVQGFKFANYGNEDRVENLTVVEMRRLFGDDVCAYIEDGECALTPAAEQWMEQANDGMDGGHCEGFAALSLLFRVGVLSPKRFGADRVHDLELEGNAKLQREIAYWMATQYASPMSEAEVSLTPSELVDRLAASFESGDDSWTLGMYFPDGSEGHATTPYAVVEHSDTEAWILHYDSNFPGEERKIVVDRKANKWTYFTSADPNEEGSVYEGDAKTKSLTITPTSARMKKLECPFCGDIDEDSDGEESEESETGRAKKKQGMRMITLDGGADLMITDESGKRIGHANGALVNEIPGAKVVVPRGAKKGLRAHEPVYYVPGGKKLRATIDGTVLKKQEQTDVALIAPGYTMGVYGIELEPGEKDQIEFSADWRRLTYTTQTAATPNLEIGISTAAADYEFDINASSESTGVRVDVALDAKAGTITVIAVAKDGSAEYEIEIRRLASDTRTQVFKHKGITARPKDRFVFHYKAWKGNSHKLHVDVDHDGDGTSDETEELDDED